MSDPQQPSKPEGESDAAAFWIDRARNVQGAAAVLPSKTSRWLGYHAWTSGMLQRWTVSRAGRPRINRFVDLGCGRGEWTELFAPISDEVFACDVADAFVAETRGRLAVLGHPKVTVVQSDLRSYEVPDGIEVAYLGAVLMYLGDAEVIEVLSKLRRSCAPGARVIVRDYCTFNFGRPSQHPHSWHRSPPRLRALAEQAGLGWVETRSSASIYAEVMGNVVTRWPLAALWRLATVHWTRASHTLVFDTPGA